MKTDRSIGKEQEIVGHDKIGRNNSKRSKACRSNQKAPIRRIALQIHCHRKRIGRNAIGARDTLAVHELLAAKLCGKFNELHRAVCIRIDLADLPQVKGSAHRSREKESRNGNKKQLSDFANHGDAHMFVCARSYAPRVYPDAPKHGIPVSV
ncbi:MAG: hypothetical protein JNJ55_01935 [Betaproteobacteria bacterium]|nr:hypothetical protein [Betaproteobacteria bacterium]